MLKRVKATTLIQNNYELQQHECTWYYRCSQYPVAGVSFWDFVGTHTRDSRQINYINVVVTEKMKKSINVACILYLIDRLFNSAIARSNERMDRG